MGGHPFLACQRHAACQKWKVVLLALCRCFDGVNLVLSASILTRVILSTPLRIGATAGALRASLRQALDAQRSQSNDGPARATQKTNTAEM